MGGKKPIYPDPLPFWFTNMSEKGLLTGKDIALLFGFKHSGVAVKEMACGSFPKPDQRLGDFKHFRHAGKNKKCLWLKATIMAEIDRRKKVCTQ